MYRLKLIFMVVCSVFLQTSALSNEHLSVVLNKALYGVGDSVQFKAMLNTDDTMSAVSKVIYVDLLAPEGFVVERKVCKLNDNCYAGALFLSPDAKTGIFELRAYTRFMLFQDKDNYFSQTFPVCEIVDGTKMISDRKRLSAGVRECLWSTHFTIKPEQSLTVRGKLLNGVSHKRYTNIPIVLTVDGQNKQAVTDADGQFEFSLDSLQGTKDALLTYSMSCKKHPSIVLDTEFYPEARPYTKEDYQKAHSLAVLADSSQACSDRTVRTKDFMSSFYDMGSATDYFNTSVEKRDHCEPLLRLLEFYGLAKCPVRLVNTVNDIQHFLHFPKDVEVYDNGWASNLEDCEYVVISSDSATCKFYSYEKYPPLKMKKNKERSLSSDNEFLYRGINHRDGGGIPSAVIFFVPYPKGTPLTDRWKNTQPNVRHAVLQGFSE